MRLAVRWELDGNLMGTWTGTSLVRDSLLRHFEAHAGGQEFIVVRATRERNMLIERFVNDPVCDLCGKGMLAIRRIESSTSDHRVGGLGQR